MSMADDLLKIKQRFNALRPVACVDTILSTRCPISPEEMIRVEYKDRAYLIVSWETMQKIASQFRQNNSSSPFFLFPVRVIENEKLVAEILSIAYAQQPARGMTKEVGSWILDSFLPGETVEKKIADNLDAIKARLERLFEA